MNYPAVSIPVSISAFDCWRFDRLEGHAIQLIAAARFLLAVRGHELSHSRYVAAKDLLDQCVGASSSADAVL